MMNNSGKTGSPRFKVGDLVKCIHGSYGVKVGGVYRVTRSFIHYSGWAVDTDVESLLYESRFVLAKESNVLKLLKAIDESI